MSVGIDAEMFVRTKEPVTAEQVRQWAYEMGCAFGADRFWIFRSESSFSGKDRPAMQVVEVYEQDGPDIVPEPGETFVRVYPATRYYGTGYARGDFPFLAMLARWLHAKIPGGEVWYGGDSSGVCAAPWRDQEGELFACWAESGRLSYMKAFDRDNNPRIPSCRVCGPRLIQNGWGGNGSFMAAFCPGCGWDIETRDGGKAWVDRPQDRA